jgi:hypothetical protein
MKTTCKILILFASIFLEAAVTMAQVTVGSLFEPAQGALLDLKEQEADANNVTATSGGLLLPRVVLTAVDEFSLLSLSDDQEKDHTGLLVYNVKEDEILSLEKGIYQWDGSNWRELKKISKEEGVTIKKTIYLGVEPDNNNTVSLGVFEFRINSSKYSQFRLADGVDLYKTVYWQISEYWDTEPTQPSPPVTPPKDIDNSTGGYDFTLWSKTFNGVNGWTDCKNYLSNHERNELWIADLSNNNIYQVQFLILGDENPNINNTYLILARKY